MNKILPSLPLPEIPDLPPITLTELQWYDLVRCLERRVRAAALTTWAAQIQQDLTGEIERPMEKEEA